MAEIGDPVREVEIPQHEPDPETAPAEAPEPAAVLA